MDEHKETTLAEVLRKAVDFIRATKIYAESRDAPKKAKAPVDRNPARRDRRPKLKTVEPCSTTGPRCVPMEVKEHPILKRPHPMTLASRPHNVQKYCEFMNTTGIQLLNARS